MDESLEEKIQFEYHHADFVAVGTFVHSTQFSSGNFAIEGIWKGPDFKILNVWTSDARDIGTRTVIYAHQYDDRGSEYSDFSMACYLPMILHKVDYADFIAKTEELFGPPRKPDMFTSNLMFVLGLILFFIALIGISLVVIKQVSLHKSLDTGVSDAGID